MNYFGEEPDPLRPEGDNMESWRKVWQNGVCPQLTDDDLLVLWEALTDNDPRLLQGMTTQPPPLMCVQDWPCEGGCPLAYVGAHRHGGLMPKPALDLDWDSSKCATVGEAEEEFAKISYAVDQQLGEPAGVHWFLNWWDSTSRDIARVNLLHELEMELERRGVDQS